jgi:hypothetical protein
VRFYLSPLRLRNCAASLPPLFRVFPRHQHRTITRIPGSADPCAISRNQTVIAQGNNAITTLASGFQTVAIAEHSDSFVDRVGLFQRPEWANTMKIEDLVARYQRDVESARTRYNRSREQITAILDQAKRAGNSHLSETQDRQCESLLEAADRAKEELRSAEAALSSAKEIEADENRLEERLNVTHKTSAPRRAGTASLSIGRNERTYHPGVDAERGLSNSPGGSFLLDAAQAAMGDYSAQERLQRHMQEERVEKPWLERANSGTAQFTGLVVPFYATQDAAPAVSAARPMADVMQSRELPQTGMTVSQSRITTPTAAGIQTTQNTLVTSQAISDTILTLNVETAAGYVQLSRQAVERGILTEDITVSDLLTRVAVSLEAQMLAEASVGLATSTFTLGQTYTNATLDTTAVPTFLKQLPAAQNAIEVALLTRARPGYVVMHPRRFNWLTAASSASWPLLSGGLAPVQSSGVMLTDSYGPSVRAVLTNGMKLVSDANVTTVALGTALSGGSQDHCYVISAQESYLYEPPQRTVMLRAEQPSSNQLGILFTAWEFFAYTFGRYQNQSVLINGTGLGTPSFA